MNKVFKIVFNAARGKMMVVNEATSSVQTGKKAAVTVAVIGALAAGSAFAANTTIETNAHIFGGTSYVQKDIQVPNQEGSKGVYAGSHNTLGSADKPLTMVVDESNFVMKSGTSNWALYGGGRYDDSDSVTIGSKDKFHQDGDAFVEIGQGENSPYGVTGQLDIFAGSSLRVKDSYLFVKNSSVKVKNSDINGYAYVTEDGVLDAYTPGRIFGAGNVQYTSNAHLKHENTYVEVENVHGVVALDGHDDKYTGDPDDLAVDVHGGGMVFNASNTTLETTNTNVVVKGTYDESSGYSTVVHDVLGGSFSSGSNSQNGTKLLATNTSVSISGSQVKGDVIGGHRINQFGAEAKVTGQSTISITNGSEVGLVIGGNLIDTDYPKHDGFTGTRVSTSGDVNVVVNDSVVTDSIVGAGYILAGSGSEQLGDQDKAGMQSTIKNVDVQLDNVKVAGDVLVGGLIQTIEGATTALVVSDSVSLVAKNTQVEGVITTDTTTSYLDLNAEDQANPSDKSRTYQAAQANDVSMTLINVEAGEVRASKGTVEIRAEGDGTTSIGKLSVGADVQVVMTADGAANDAAGGDITKAIEISEGSGVSATVAMEEGDVIGEVTAKLADGKVVAGSVTQAVNKKTEALAEQVTLAPQMITRIMMNDVRKRMGDLRAAEGTHGVWARYNGGQMAGSGMESDFHMVQVGIDTVPVADAPRFGVAFSYAQSEAEATNGLATTDMDSFSLAFYGTKMYDSGMFVDVIGRMATMDTEMNVQGNKAQMDNVALSLSGELGWRFDVTDRFFFEPSVEATYTYTNADRFTMGSGNYELDAVDSLVGRAGFAAGFKCPANKGDVYIRAAVVHEFMGDTTMRSGTNGTFNAAPVETDGKDTWFEYAIGAQFNVNKNTYVYADIERTEGATMDEDWRANVGVRFAF